MIQYLHKKGLTPKAIHADRVATLGKDAPSYATLKGGWQNLSMAGRALRMTPVLEGLSLWLTPEIVTKVHDNWLWVTDE